MKTWIAFVAGGLFALALVITCGGRNGGPGGSANAAGDVVWEYATVDFSYSSPRATMPSGVAAPASIGSCSDNACMLNAFGADKWELSQFDTSNFWVFKRPK